MTTICTFQLSVAGDTLDWEHGPRTRQPDVTPVSVMRLHSCRFSVCTAESSVRSRSTLSNSLPLFLIFLPDWTRGKLGNRGGESRRPHRGPRLSPTAGLVSPAQHQCPTQTQNS